MANQQERWRAVGRAMRARIDELGLTKAEVIAASGVSDKTLNGYLEGEPIRRQDKARELSKALGWTPDSIRRIIAGGEPELVTSLAITEALKDAPPLPDDLLQWVSNLSERDQDMLFRFAKHIATVSAGLATDLIENLGIVRSPASKRHLAIAAKEGMADAAAVARQVKKAKPGARPRPRTSD